MASWLQQQSKNLGGTPEDDHSSKGSPPVLDQRNSGIEQRAPLKSPQVNRRVYAGSSGPAKAGLTSSGEGLRTENEKLYEAYNDLHTLAQDFQKPFDSPAICVVGHQTDGKSALIEALMGFQFNHVGGGTKTRRPISLLMKYNAACVQPKCCLVTEDAGEKEVTLEELQEHIEVENGRLERDGQFWSKEIVVKIEYKYSPNLTIIDTPGLISAAPGKKNSGLQTAAKHVEAMVRQKLEQREYIILCLEDSSDWSNASTRKLVMQVDPQLQRTVVVSTKLDTRIPQFARTADVELFLHPPAGQLEPRMLGAAPFFTSVPSGRVGSAADAVFRTNDQYREAVAAREAADLAALEHKLDRRLDKAELGRTGVSQLRRFLERLLQRRYLENVPSIVPLLEKEFRNAQAKVLQGQVEIDSLQPDKLKEKGRLLRDAFIGKLQALLRGTTSAPPERFGETLADEHLRGGAFIAPDSKPVPVTSELPNTQMRLYGGAQYHRAMQEFRMSVGRIGCPDISREEIVNACGVDDFHDGANYIRTACMVAVSKAKQTFEPFLHQLGYRLAHNMKRLLPICMYLLQKEGVGVADGHEPFLKRIGASFHAYVDAAEQKCRSRCMEDLSSATDYVSWSLHTNRQAGLRNMLNMVALPASEADAAAAGSAAGAQRLGERVLRDSETPQGSGVQASQVAAVLESTLWSRSLSRVSEEVVAALVGQIFENIRDFIVQCAEMKFNTFFLIPCDKDFPSQLREEVEAAYDEDLDKVFNVVAVRASLEARLRQFESERLKVEKLQRQFAAIHQTLAQQSIKPDTEQLCPNTHAALTAETPLKSAPHAAGRAVLSSTPLP